MSLVPTKWEFRKYKARDKQSDSGSTARHIGGSVSLVRESIQNSLDAVKNGKEPVELQIKFKPLPLSECREYFGGLDEHYKACPSHSGKDILPSGISEIQFLILEDFNTKGLEGDKYDAFLFRDNIRTSTSKTDGGSHGTGKTVFYMSSPTKTFFAYSVFKQDDGVTSVFEGTCDFESHSIGEATYGGYGSRQLSPQHDNEFIRSLFTRQSDSTGLSIAIPLPYDYLKTDELKKAIIDECYYPIIDEKLKVNVEGETIDSTRILEEATKLGGGLKQKLISNYATAPKYYQIPIGTRYRKLETRKDALSEGLSKENTKQISAELDEGKVVIIRFTVAIQLKQEGRDEEGYLYLVIAKKEDDSPDNFDFWRGYSLVKDALGRNSSSATHSVIAIIPGEGNELGVLMRLLELPDHLKWDYDHLEDKKQEPIKNNYGYYREIQAFIPSLPNKVINHLRTSELEVGNKFLSNYFSTSKLGRAGGKGGRGKDKRKRQIITPSVKYAENDAKDGFTLTLSPEGKSNEVSKITIKVAYATNRGNAFNNYDDRDFYLGDTIPVKKSGCKISIQEGNELSCLIQDADDFRVSLTGFATDRELAIEIRDEADER